jgi:hypothetical protein
MELIEYTTEIMSGEYSVDELVDMIAHTDDVKPMVHKAIMDMVKPRILEQHGVQWSTRSGRLFALECYTDNGIPGSQWIDVTGFSTRKLYDWLGY